MLFLCTCLHPNNESTLLDSVKVKMIKESIAIFDKETCVRWVPHNRRVHGQHHVVFQAHEEGSVIFRFTRLNAQMLYKKFQHVLSRKKIRTHVF